MPDQREWLSILVCISTAVLAILLFYIFRGKPFGQNYIQRCKLGSTIAMQPRAWMTTYLFSAWISYFIAYVCRVGEISLEHRHLLILDGYNNHVTLEVVQEARAIGLDFISLPSHMSHALQPLDVCCFKSFKQHFTEYMDFWSSQKMYQATSMEMLAH